MFVFDFISFQTINSYERQRRITNYFKSLAERLMCEVIFLREVCDLKKVREFFNVAP